jgi:hypothetical protein
MALIWSTNSTSDASYSFTQADRCSILQYDQEAILTKVDWGVLCA